MEKNENKVVLAFSGGLDTSYCVKYLSQEKGLEVYSALVNTGGFSDEEIQLITDHAYQLGVKEHVNLDETDAYYQKCIRFLIYGNILRNQTYPLSVSSERIFQALAVVQYARLIGANYLAHGSTGAGNDQVRFDLAFQVLAPDIEIITPIRDQKLSRQEEIEYLRQHGVEGDWKKSLYSINQGLWGTSVGGKETLTSHQSLPDEAYPSPLEKTDSQEINLLFEQGELVGLNDQKSESPVQAIQELQALAHQYAIGRDIHVGDTIIGIKGRVGFEAAAPLMIIKAHHLLEKHTLSKWQLYWKDHLSNWYGMMLHEAQYLEPVMRDMEKFMEETQSRVSGKVFIKLLPYRFELLGIESPYDLMRAKFGQYGEMNNAWTGDDVRGFTKILSNPLMIYQSLENKEEN